MIIGVPGSLLSCVLSQNKAEAIILGNLAFPAFDLCLLDPCLASYSVLLPGDS